MLIEHEGERPRIAPSAYVAPTAVVCGDVTIGEDSRILFNAVVTADGGAVEIGARCIVMEHALVRGRAAHPTRIGDNVLVGPHAHVNGALVEENAFLATGASVFPAPASEAARRFGSTASSMSTAPWLPTPPFQSVGWPSAIPPGSSRPVRTTRSGRSRRGSTSRGRSSAWPGRPR